MNHLQQRLQAAVAKRGTTARLARITGLSHTAVLKIARGKTTNPGVNTVEALERALGQLPAESEEVVSQ